MTPSARDLVRATLRRRRVIAGVALWSLVGALPTFAAGQAVAHAVDGFLAGQAPRGLLWLGGLAVTVPLGALGARRTYLGVARLVEPLRDDLVRLVVEGTLHRATGAEPARDAGSVARLTQHVEVVRDTIAGLALLLLGFVAGLVSALVGLATLAPLVVPLVLGPLAVSLALFATTVRATMRHQRRVLVADERLAELTADVTAGLRDVVACGGEDHVTARLDDRIDAQVAAGRAMAGIGALRTLVVSLGCRLPVVLLLVSAGWLLDRGTSPGALIGSLIYLIQGLEPAVASMVAGVGAPLAQLVVTTARIDAAGTAPACDASSGGDGDDDTAPPAGRRSPRDGSVRLREVTFRYPGAAAPVVDGLALDVADGEHMAIVGPSGQGKSSLAGLLVGLLRPQHGSVELGGRPAAAVDAGWRVLIPQEAYVFGDSLAANLRYLRPTATTATLEAAVEAVGMAPLVSRLGGYEARVEPASLSAGERQLVALARAYVAPARLVVLDEATCHLDPAAEAVAETAFAAQGRTLVVVAHRLSSARRAGRILVMADGVTALGTHESLRHDCPPYAALAALWDGARTG